MRLVSFDGPDAQEEEDLQKVCLYVVGSEQFFFHSPKTLCTPMCRRLHIYSQHIIS